MILFPARRWRGSLCITLRYRCIYPMYKLLNKCVIVLHSNIYIIFELLSRLRGLSRQILDQPCSNCEHKILLFYYIWFMYHFYLWKRKTRLNASENWWIGHPLALSPKLWRQGDQKFLLIGPSLSAKTLAIRTCLDGIRWRVEVKIFASQTSISRPVIAPHFFTIQYLIWHTII